MKKLSAILLLFSVFHTVFAAPLFYNKTERPIEITYVFCDSEMWQPCLDQITTTVKAKSFSFITPPTVQGWNLVLGVISAKVRKEDNTIVARGDYPLSRCASRYINYNENKPVNFVIAFDDMFGSPTINCETNMVSGDQS